MHPLHRAAALLLAQTQRVRWIQPPRGSLRRGLWWVRSPRIALGVALALLVLTLAAAVYRRLRRRP